MKSLSRSQFSLRLGYSIFGAVLLVRILALARVSSSAFLLPTRGDMHFYNDWALRILGGQLTDHLAFYGLPLYAYLLAILYRILGYNPFIPGFLQACLDAGTAVLVYAIALSVFRREHESVNGARSGDPWYVLAVPQPEIIGAAAALAWAVFIPAEAYAVVLMPTTWFVFVFWLVVWRIVRSESAPSLKECLLLGFLIGVTAMGIATIVVLLPLLLAALLIRSKIYNGAGGSRATRWGKPWIRTIIAGTAFILTGVGVGSSPCWIHNYILARDPVFLSAHSGINFWIGNNPVANGYPRFPPGLRAGQAAMLQDSITAAETVAGHPLKRSQVSAYWSAKAEEYIVKNFAAWLRLMAVKLRNFWNAFQYDDLSIVTNLREQRIILPGLSFGIVAALAIPGMLFGWRLASRSRWVTAAILLHMVSLLAVFVTERYRLAVVPGLLLFAVLGLSILWESCVAGNYQRLAIYCALLVGSTIFVSWPQRDPSLWALDAYNSGWQALESNDLPLAEKKLALAYAYVPENSETNFALGNLRLAQGNAENAKSFYRSTLDIDPRHKGAANNLGVIALDEHQLGAAEMWFRRAVDVDPRNAKTHFLLAKTLFDEGNRPAALTEIDEAIALNPAQPEFVALRDEIRSLGAP